MAFCSKCGQQVEDGVKFCPACGAAIGGTEEPKAEEKKDLGAQISALNDTADTTADYDAQDIAANKAMAILAYLGILVLIPIFAAKESKFARFHANQGLVLLIAWVAWGIVGAIIGAIVSAIFLAISWRLLFIVTIFNILIWLIHAAFAVLAILGIVNAASGKAKELPIIGKYKILK